MISALVAQIILGIVYALGLPALAGVPAVFFFLPMLSWVLSFYIYGTLILIIGIIMPEDESN